MAVVMPVCNESALGLWNLKGFYLGCPFVCTHCVRADALLPGYLRAEKTLQTLALSPQNTEMCCFSVCFYFILLILLNFILLIWINNLKFHSERWITRLANRWRAQQSAITIANCRIYWAAITWTQMAASGIPGATFAWGSILIKNK